MIMKYNEEVSFSIDNIFCKYFIYNSNKPIVITFAPLNPLSRDDVNSNKSPWGFDFIKNKIKLNVISFQHIEIDKWYISDKFKNFIKELSKEIRIFTDKLGYGVSMGGYGVSAYSNILELNRILLINPISTLNNEIVTWERRWKPFQKQLDWSNALDGANTKVKGYIIFDPLFDLENFHAKRFTSLTQLKAFGAGHSVPAYLTQMGLLQKLFNDFLNQNIDKNEYYKIIRDRRKNKHYYNYMLGKNNIHLTPIREQVLLSFKQKYL